MRLNLVKRMEMRDFPDAPGWFATFLGEFNTTATQLVQLLQGRVSLFSNTNVALKEIVLTDSVETVVPSPVTDCKGALVLRARQTSGGHPLDASSQVVLGVRLVGKTHVGLTPHFPDGKSPASVTVMFVGA